MCKRVSAVVLYALLCSAQIQLCIKEDWAAQGLSGLLVCKATIPRVNGDHPLRGEKRGRGCIWRHLWDGAFCP